jgi:hypothetical protein
VSLEYGKLSAGTYAAWLGHPKEATRSRLRSICQEEHT